MENKSLQNVFKNALTFLIIFLVINFIFNSFFSNKESAAPVNGVIFKTVDSVPLNQNIIVNLTNNTATDISIKNNCPSEPLPVQFFDNGTWQNITYKADISCENTSDLTVKPGESQKISFSNWAQELFTKKGDYKVLLPMNDTVIESNQFKVKDQSFFSWLWTILLYQPIYNALIFFASFLPFHDFGLAIILLTIIIRTLLLLAKSKSS